MIDLVLQESVAMLVDNLYWWKLWDVRDPFKITDYGSRSFKSKPSVPILQFEGHQQNDSAINI